ncbi:unnamed protein product, partial [Didymodactylos carnosus]
MMNGSHCHTSNLEQVPMKKLISITPSVLSQQKQTQDNLLFTSDLFQRVISAVLCSFSQSTSNNDKHVALEYLENLKENHILLCCTIGFEFIKQQQQPLLHHYGIHLIENIIKYKWSALKPDERNVLEEQLFSLIKTNLNDSFMEPIYIRTALARCTVEMIKRECFEKTNTPLEELITLTQQTSMNDEFGNRNLIQLELILLVYRFLNEELTVYQQSIPSQRRRQLLSQLQKRLNDILPSIMKTLNDLLLYSQEKVPNGDRLIETCLLCLNSFLSWIDYTQIEQYETYLIELLMKFFHLTQQIRLRHAAFECLLSFINRRFLRQRTNKKPSTTTTTTTYSYEQERIFINYLLNDNTLELFYRLVMCNNNNSDSEITATMIEQFRTLITNEHLTFLKMLGQFLLKITTHLLYLFQQLTSRTPIDNEQFLPFLMERIKSFIQFLLLLNDHPYHQLSLNSYQALSMFISKQSSPFYLLLNEQLCLKLIENLKQSLVRIHFPLLLPSSTIVNNTNECFVKQYQHSQQCLCYIMFEFDSEDQFFWKSFSQYRLELQKLIKAFTDMIFVTTGKVKRVKVVGILSDGQQSTNMNYLNSILKYVMQYLINLIQRTPTELNHQSSVITAYLINEWESLYLLIDHILFVLRKHLFPQNINNNLAIQQQQLLMKPDLIEQFLYTIKYLLQFTPSTNENIYGYVLNILSVMFFVTNYDQTLIIQILQRLLTTYQHYQQQSLVGDYPSDLIQSQTSNAFLYLCRNYTLKLIDYYSDLYPYLCQLIQNEFQHCSIKTSTIMNVDDNCSILKLLDSALCLMYKKLTIDTANDEQINYFYELLKPIYEFISSNEFSNNCLSSLTNFIQYFKFAYFCLDFCQTNSNQEQETVYHWRRRRLMLCLHCLCCILKFSKHQQDQTPILFKTKIILSLRPFLFDSVLKIIRYCNQLYDPNVNPFYDLTKTSLLSFSETEKQIYLGTYESNNITKATVTTITATTFSPSDNPFHAVRQSPLQDKVSNRLFEHQLHDYIHRLFDISYQLLGSYFVYDHDLYSMKTRELTDNKLNEQQQEQYFLTSFLQTIIFENLNTIPPFRLRIILKHFCRPFIEHFSLTTEFQTEQSSINDLFLSFLDIFLPYIQQRLRQMWQNLISNEQQSQQSQLIYYSCSDEVIEECLCVLLTRDFVDILRHFILKPIISITNNKKQDNQRKTTITSTTNKILNGNHEMSYLDDNDIDTTVDDVVDNNNNEQFTNKQLNISNEKIDYSDLFLHLSKICRNGPNVTSSYRTCINLFNSVIQILFECLTFPDAYCVNRFLPIILPLMRLHYDITKIDAIVILDVKLLFSCLLKSLQRHGENEGLITNILSLIGHIYELWHDKYSPSIDNLFITTIPNFNTELLTTYKMKICSTESKKPLTERERREILKNLFGSLIGQTNKKETLKKNIKNKMLSLSMSFDEQSDVNYYQFDPKTVVEELKKAISELDFVGLVHSRKWCSEMLNCITSSTKAAATSNESEMLHNNDDNDGIHINISSRELGTSASIYMMAKCYFDLREYKRCAHHLKQCTTGYGFFLRVYSLYLDGLKQRCDDFVDVFPDTAVSQRQATTTLDNSWLINLRCELTTSEKNETLDGYGYYVYALVLKRLSLLNEALIYFIKTVQLIPHLWSAWEDLAYLIDTEQKLHSLDLPEHWIRNVFYARCYIELHKPELCIFICKELNIIGFQNSTYILLQQAKAYENGAELQLARSCCEDARTIDPYNLDSMDVYSNILFVLEDYHALAGLAQKCIEIEKFRFETCIVVGNFYSIRNDHARAIQYFTRALRMNPDYAAAWILLGHEFVEGKNHAAAINAYR